MSTFYVRKNGSGTHTDIQSAIYVAVNGDTVDIGEGTFNENVEISSKSITLQGAGKDKTIIQGKATNDAFTGCSYYGGEFVTTVSSTSGLIVGKTVSGLTANAKISEIVSSTQFKTAVANPTAGNITKTGVTWLSNSSTITLPSTTAVVVGMKVEGSGVSALVTAYNATTKVVTLSSPTTQAGSAASLLFRKAYSNITVTQLTNPASNAFPGSIMVSGNTEGLVIKNLRAIGFENSDLGQEAAALFMYTSASPGHNNFLIDNCQITAGGDCAFLHGSKPFLTNGTFQNCIIDGNTFTGSEPTDVPSFSTYISPAIISSIGASSSVVTFADMRGVILGRTFSSAGAFTSSATVTGINGNSVTINKVITGTVGSSIDCTFGLTQYSVPNVPRNLFYLGTVSPLYNISNITFKNNLVSGGTGAVISATGSKSVFNCGVTINSIGGLIENNVFDGNFGAGSPNEMGVNYVLRSLQPDIVVQNNVNKVSGGRGNSGFMVLLGTSTNNITINRLLVEVSQSASNTFIESMMEKGALKAISKVSSDAVFSDEANWKLVNFVFKHSSSSKRLVSSFRSTFGSSKKTKLKTNMKVGDRFELQKIIISKSDRSHLVVKRSELSGVSSFDFDLLADGPSGSNPPVSGLVWDVFFGQTASNGGGELHTTGFSWGEAAYSSTPLVGDFSVTGTFHSVLGGGTNLMIGYKKDLPASAGGASSNISSAIYVDGGIGSITGWNGSDGGASTTSSYLSNATADFSFEISRVGSVITGSVNGSMMFTDTNYSAPVYLASMIYSNNGYGIISTTLNAPVAPSAFYTRDFSSPSTPLSGEYSTIVNNLLELGQNSYELSNQPIVYEVGATYKLRVHIDSFVSGSINYFIAKISPFSGQVNVIWEYDNTAVVNAVGSYLEGTFVATPTMNSNSYKVELAASPSGSTSVCMKVSKFEIIKL